MQILESLIMQKLNEGPEKNLKGKLNLAIQIFTNQYPKKFLHQLISGQLDVDRLDYLSRDSFFTGVSEGVVGYERILKMITIHNNELVVEEKGIISVEKFLLARRLMYWQVYQHKSVVASENMLVKIIERAQYLYQQNNADVKVSQVVDYFLGEFSGKLNEINLNFYCNQFNDVNGMNITGYDKIYNFNAYDYAGASKYVDSTLPSYTKLDENKIMFYIKGNLQFVMPLDSIAYKLKNLPHDQANYYNIHSDNMTFEIPNLSGNKVKIMFNNFNARMTDTSFLINSVNGYFLLKKE